MADTESPEGLELVGEHGGEEERDVWGNTHVARAVLDTLATRSQAPVRSRVSQPHRGAAPSSHLLGYGLSGATSALYWTLVKMRHERIIYQVCASVSSVHHHAQDS